MARRNYRTQGSAAFAPQPKEPERRKSQQPTKSPELRPLTRKRVQLREPGVISFDAIAGFICICAMSGLLMNSYAQLATSADQVVQLRRELSQLEADKLLLSAQYEKYFDIQRIESTLGNDMMLPTNEQVVYIDLSKADNVTIYGKEDQESQGFFSAFLNLFEKN